jgi:nitrite reductase/ring-hydroxylating ferredoxin subunit
MTRIDLTMVSNTDGLTRLCALDDLSEDEPLCAKVDGVGYAVFKVGELAFVTADRCTHGPGYLSEGYVEGFEVECPFHQGKFDFRTGQPTEAPCEIPLATWSPVIEGGAVYIDITQPNAN